ncbi:maltose O-acetyltransferase [Saccharothrix violaceirubra]|uniref:Maltose O-acetyltransferase n=2 Tax=Saccharothrix violaceirubra TaxID=413306 RepID=A0A7W7T3M1_9PSEU|nr:maltose O-acetyltransferase [Saccharothrix violaceirubra]
MERMTRGDWYLDGPDLVGARDRCRRLLDRFNATADDDARRPLMAGLFAHVGPGAVVLPRFRCSYGTQITLGAHCFVNTDALFMDDAAITIGDHARLGPDVRLVTALHPVEDHDRRKAGWERAAPVTIGANAWLGVGVIVCPGVTVGADTVVGAGSVVIRDLPDRVFAAGNPARVIRAL